MLRVDKRTIFRYIRDINIPFEDSGYGLIESSRNGYRFIDTNFLDKLKGIDDIYTIAAVETSPFGHKLQEKSIISDEIRNKILPRLSQKHFIDNDVLKHLLHAMTKNRILEIDYNKNGTCKKYTILPLKIVSNSGTNYLQLYCFNNDKLRLLSFMVSKIEKIIPKDICLDRQLIRSKMEFINSRWGTFINEKDNFQDRDIVRFMVDDSIYLNLIKQPLHSSQEYFNDNGRHVFSLKIHNIQEFSRWCTKFGYHLTVLESQAVIDSILWDARKLIDKYS